MLHFGARGREQSGNARTDERFDIQLEVRLDVDEQAKATVEESKATKDYSTG
jgi:hypothetical protein